MRWGSHYFVNFLYEGHKKRRRLKKTGLLSSWHYLSASQCPLMCIQRFFLQSVCPAFIPLSSNWSRDCAYVCECVCVGVCVRACKGVCHVVFCVWILYLLALCLCASVCVCSQCGSRPSCVTGPFSFCGPWANILRTSLSLLIQPAPHTHHTPTRWMQS